MIRIVGTALGMGLFVLIRAPRRATRWRAAERWPLARPCLTTHPRWRSGLSGDPV